MLSQTLNSIFFTHFLSLPFVIYYSILTDICQAEILRLTNLLQSPTRPSLQLHTTCKGRAFSTVHARQTESLPCLHLLYIVLNVSPPTAADGLAVNLAFFNQFGNVFQTGHMPDVAVVTNVTQADTILTRLLDCFINLFFHFVSLTF